MNRLAWLVLCVVLGLQSPSRVVGAEDAQTALHRANKLVELARSNLKETNYEKAEYYYNRALVIVREHRPLSSSIPNILFKLGRLSVDSGADQKALDYFKQAAEVQKQQGPDTSQMAALWYEMAKVQSDLGNLPEARKLAASAADLMFRRAPKGQLILDIWRLQALIEVRDGEVDAAESFALKVMTRQHKEKPRSLELADALDDLGRMNLTAGRFVRSEAYYKQSLVLREFNAPTSYSYGKVLNVLGFLYRELGKPDRAEGSLLKAEERFLDLEPWGLELARNQRVLGRLYMDMDRAEKSGERFERALDIVSVRLPHTREHAGALLDLARWHRARGKEKDALTYYEQAFDVSRNWMGRSRNVSDPRVVRERRERALLDSHFEWIGMAVESGNKGQVFERVQALRSYRSFVAMTDHEAFSIGWADAFAERQRALVKDRDQTLAAIGSWELPRHRSHVDELIGYLGGLQVKWNELRAEHRNANPGVAELYAGASVSVRDIRKKLEKSEVLLSYAVGTDETVLQVFTSKRPYHHVYKIDMTGVALEERVRMFLKTLRGSVKDTQGIAAAKAMGAELYGQLIAPANALVKGASRVTIIPDEHLTALPFAALCATSDGAYLVEKSLVGYASSEADWVRSRNMRPAGVEGVSLMLVGAGSTVAGELGSGLKKRHAVLSKSIPGSVLVQGGDATEDLLESGRKAGLWVLGAPMREGASYPSESAFMLSPSENHGGYLTIGELVNRGDLQASTLVLSSLSQEEGGLSPAAVSLLVRSWQALGVSTVFASDWIAVGGGDPLVDALIRGLAEGKSKDVALAEAQRSMSDQHPFLWSGMKVYGAVLPDARK